MRREKKPNLEGRRGSLWKRREPREVCRGLGAFDALLYGLAAGAWRGEGVLIKCKSRFHIRVEATTPPIYRRRWKLDASGTSGAGRLGWLVGLGASFGEYEGRPTVGGPQHHQQHEGSWSAAWQAWQGGWTASKGVHSYADLGRDKHSPYSL